MKRGGWNLKKIVVFIKQTKYEYPLDENQCHMRKFKKNPPRKTEELSASLEGEIANINLSHSRVARLRLPISFIQDPTFSEPFDESIDLLNIPDYESNLYEDISFLLS